MSIHSVYDLVAMGLRSDFISTKSTLVLTFRNVSRTPWDGLTHPLGVHAPQLGNPRTRHTHTFHPLSTIVIHTLNFAQVKSMDDNCGEWVECMGVASGCGEQKVGVASGSG